MQLSYEIYPSDVTVVCKMRRDGMMSVAVYKRNEKVHVDVAPPRPRSISEYTEEEKEAFAQLLLGLITSQPGRSRTYYEQLNVKQSGFKGGQTRKEQAMRSLISSGRVKVVPLEKPLGRKNHSIFPA